MDNPQPFWVVKGLMEISTKRVIKKILGLSEVLFSRGEHEDAVRLLRSVLRGMVSFTEGLDDNFFIAAIENVLSFDLEKNLKIKNSLIQLYNEFLSRFGGECSTYPHYEHLILRSCVLHAMNGGWQAAAADLHRKVKQWKITNQDIEKEIKEINITNLDDWDLIPESDSDGSGRNRGSRKVGGRDSGILEKVSNYPNIIENRKSKKIINWLGKLNKL
jgi:hypothetical protein